MNFLGQRKYFRLFFLLIVIYVKSKNPFNNSIKKKKETWKSNEIINNN